MFFEQFKFFILFNCGLYKKLILLIIDNTKYNF